MAVNVLNTSTLSEAFSKDANEVTVASTSNVLVGNWLLIAGTGGLEAVRVQEIPVSGRVKVLRGQGGTRARAHASGTKFYIGDPDDFQSRKAGIVAGVAADASDFDDYLLPGLRYTDGAGNEFILVELTATVVPGATVLISKDGNYTAGFRTSAGVGPVGVVVENSSSDQYAWAQVYGANAHVKLVGGSSLVSSLGEFGGATSVSTPAVGLLGRSSSQRSSAYLEASTIYGMFPTSAASTASTSASSETGLFCAAFLNYPYAQRAITS
jgi:hypothetical protein